jgi:phage terminase large subunit
MTAAIQSFQKKTNKWLERNGKQFNEWLSLNKIDISKIPAEQIPLLPLRYDPTFFASAVLGIELQKWQIDFLFAIRDNDQVSVRSGTGVGKSAAVAVAILWLVFTHNPCLVACVSASEAQLKYGIWKELETWYRRMPAWARDLLEFQSERIFQKADPSGAQAVARTANADKPEALQGLHSENMIVVCDEASGIADAVFDALRGAMSSHGSKTILISNPTKTSGFFFDTHRHPTFSADWHRFHIPATPEYSNRITQKFVDSMLKQYGSEDDPQYKMRVLGEFPEIEDMVCIPRSIIEPALANQSIEEEGGLIYWGIDVARSTARDKTTIAKRQGNTLLEPITGWRSNDLMETVGKILSEYQRQPDHLKPYEIFIDTIGVGGGVYDRLKEHELPVRSINAANEPLDKEKYMRLRDELWFKSRDWFSKRNRKFKVRCDSDADQYRQLINELCVPSYAYTSSGKVKVEGKDEIRKRCKFSPDYADAFNLTLMGIDKKANEKRPAIDYSWII